MAEVVFNPVAGDNIRAVIVRQKRDIERLEAALERIRETTKDARSYEIACEALGEQVSA